MRVAWAIGTTMLVVCGSTMHATQASSELIGEEYPTTGVAVNGTDVPAADRGAEGGIRTTSLQSTVFATAIRRPRVHAAGLVSHQCA